MCGFAPRNRKNNSHGYLPIVACLLCQGCRVYELRDRVQIWPTNNAVWLAFYLAYLSLAIGREQELRTNCFRGMNVIVLFMDSLTLIAISVFTVRENLSHNFVDSFTFTYL